MRNALRNALNPLAILTSLSILLLALPAHAWKPTTHVFFGDIARQEAVQTGMVTIYRVDYATGQIVGEVGRYRVDPDVLDALTNYPAQYHAGILGPDAYPDLFTGQKVIHPPSEETGILDGADAWLRHIWYKSLQPPYNTAPIKAFALGYLTHAAGDMYGHAFVNHFTGGPFALDTSGNFARHIVLEGYVDKRLPAAALNANFFQASIAGVESFLYNNTIDARAGSVLYNQGLLRADNLGLTFGYSVPGYFSTLRNEVNVLAVDYRASAKKCAWYDITCSARLLEASAMYLEAWRADIDRGLRAWPAVSDQVAKALFFNIARAADTGQAASVLENYVTDHMLSMLGPPDVVGFGLGLTSDLISEIRSLLIPAAVEQELAPLVAAPLDYLVQEALGVSVAELRNYLSSDSSPESYFAPVMCTGPVCLSLQTFNQAYLGLTDTGYNNPNESFSWQNVPAAFNTVTISKLILLPPAEINRLLVDLGAVGSPPVSIDESNVMLGFIDTLDGDPVINEWRRGEDVGGGMILADSSFYRQIFMNQPGDLGLRNSRPRVNNDIYYTPVNELLSVGGSKPGVLNNDEDPDGDSLTAQLNPNYPPQHGTLLFYPGGNFDYTPTNPNAIFDTFQYRAQDSEGLDSGSYATVSIRFTEENIPPVAVYDYYWMNGTHPQRTNLLRSLDVAAPGLLENDFDANGDPLTVQCNSQPSNGTLSCSSDGSFRYIPNRGYQGLDSFTYVAKDGPNATSEETTVTIEVRPGLVSIQAESDYYMVIKNRPLSIPAPGILINDTHEFGSPLTARYDSNTGVRGTVVIESDGSVLFTPETDFVGAASGVDYNALDEEGYLSNYGVVGFRVRESNAIPVATKDTYVFDIGLPLEIAAPGVLANDFDEDYDPALELEVACVEAFVCFPSSDPLTSTLVNGPQFGTLALRPDGSFDYTPGAGFNGRDSFTYEVFDTFDTSNTALVWIADRSINDAPIAISDSYEVVSGGSYESAAPGVLANDSDSDGDPLRAWLETDVSSGTLKLNGDGSFAYTPNAGYSGSDQFSYRVTDSVGGSHTALVSLNVQAGATFLDVPPGYWSFSFIEALARAGITVGCGNNNYCPGAPVTRAEMAVFLERGMNGSSYSPPAATGTVFNDVGAGNFGASFIEQLYADGITVGCGNQNYCPNEAITRAQMAVFLLRAKYGSSYSPPPASGVFNDVGLGYWAVHWIEQLAAEGITVGCGNNNYCPEAPVTRDQMAVFLVRTFGL